MKIQQMIEEISRQVSLFQTGTNSIDIMRLDCRLQLLIDFRWFDDDDDGNNDDEYDDDDDVDGNTITNHHDNDEDEMLLIMKKSILVVTTKMMLAKMPNDKDIFYDEGFYDPGDDTDDAWWRWERRWCSNFNLPPLKFRFSWSGAI